MIESKVYDKRQREKSKKHKSSKRSLSRGGNRSSQYMNPLTDSYD